MNEQLNTNTPTDDKARDEAIKKARADLYGRFGWNIGDEASEFLFDAGVAHAAALSQSVDENGLKVVDEALSDLIHAAGNILPFADNKTYINAHDRDVLRCIAATIRQSCDTIRRRAK